jgi:hypothetical protein
MEMLDSNPRLVRVVCADMMTDPQKTVYLTIVIRNKAKAELICARKDFDVGVFSDLADNIKYTRTRFFTYPE